MLAQRISSINSLSAICEKTGANIDELSKAIGMDHRIGPHFLKSSVGFGGSCFQKDILNLVYLCKHYGLNQVAEYWNQVIKINDYQRERFGVNILELLNSYNINGRKVAILGWSFKANTNDSRESSSIYVSKFLIKNRIHLNIYDPVVKEDVIFEDLHKVIGDESFKTQIKVFNNLHSTIKNSSLISILVDWHEFKGINIDKYKGLFFYDGRNILSQKGVKSLGK